jgi:opacity protein-like surface antigen
MLYLSQHTREQGTQFNFNEYVGFGVHYFLKKNLALTLEYRYRHISTAGLDEPNKGINTNFTLCGASYTF